MAPRMTFHIRKAQIEDARRLAALSTQLGYPASPKVLKARLNFLLKNREHMVLVAESTSGEVVAWVHAYVRTLVESDPHVEIGGLVVDQRFRGRGVGRLLLQRAERWALRKGLESVYLRSNIIRKDAHRFYESLGYARIKTQHAYLKILKRGGDNQAR